LKRAALYLRVSTLDQHPETQLHDLERMAEQRGYEIVQRYTDRITGTRARRPGLDQMLTDARRGRFDVVLVWACDRLARSTRHFLEVLDELNHLNLEFVSFRENLDTGGPLGRAVVVISMRRVTLIALAYLCQLGQDHAFLDPGFPNALAEFGIL
jgi:DNA invertase Pin-like site-specific DNA recombinase